MLNEIKDLVPQRIKRKHETFTRFDVDYALFLFFVSFKHPVLQYASYEDMLISCKSKS